MCLCIYVHSENSEKEPLSGTVPARRLFDRSLHNNAIQEHHIFIYAIYTFLYMFFFFPSFFMSSPGMNLITTIIGFGMIATFIVFVCSRLIFGRIRGVGSRQMSEIESRIDLEQAANIEAEGSGIPDCEYQLTKHEVSCLGHGKYSGILQLVFCILFGLSSSSFVNFCLPASPSPYFSCTTFKANINLLCQLLVHVKCPWREISRFKYFREDSQK
ncbi:uncharacterized protein LOC114295614 [Camellia sinensis]|uniref:uncharacterized protein LOC114295614 n=1 Tax=Camellia sinensis TaxID=4442 RepID=UPI00103650F8|nr:uncharacterized protein LOC114295614 [Camellia sinensis]